MDAAAGEAAYADAQKSSDKQEPDLDPEAFEDDGKNEFKGMDKKEKKKAKKSKREKEEAKHAGGVLGMFAVKRVCLRGHRYDCLLYTSPSPRDQRGSRMPSSA